MLHLERSSARVQRCRVVVAVGVLLWVSFVAGAALAQTPLKVQVTVTYTGSLGPISGQRPVCLCFYLDPNLQAGIGCFVSPTNSPSFQFTTFAVTPYYMIGFVDLDGNESPSPNEPYEIYDNRATPPGDGVVATAEGTNIDMTFGDENLTPTATPSATPTTERTATPTDMPTGTPTETPLPTVMATASPTPTLSACTGDCDGSGTVTIDEIITMVNIALGQAPVAICAAGDRDGNQVIEIDELIAAVNNAILGCPGSF